METMFRNLYPEFTALPVTEKDDSIILGMEGNGLEITLSPYQGGWGLYLREAHGHFETLEEGLSAAVGLLRSTIRSCEEYRGELLAQTWLESKVEEDAFEVGHLSVYLSPFDLEEWELEAGESWKQVRTTRTYDAATGTISAQKSERFADKPLEDDRPVYKWLTEGIGPAQDGMRWIVAAQGRFVLQAPTGWKNLHQNHEGQFVDYALGESGPIFRVAAYFRESEEPTDVQIGAAQRATSIENEVVDTDPHWYEDQWRLFFSDGEQEMLGVIHLYSQKALSDDIEPIRDLIRNALPYFLMAPNEWDMKTIAPS